MGKLLRSPKCRFDHHFYIIIRNNYILYIFMYVFFFIGYYYTNKIWYYDEKWKNWFIQRWKETNWLPIAYRSCKLENAKAQYGHQEILSLSGSWEVSSDLSLRQNYVFHVLEEARLLMKSSLGRCAVGQFRHCPRKRRAENGFGGFRDYRQLI